MSKLKIRTQERRIRIGGSDLAAATSSPVPLWMLDDKGGKKWIKASCFIS
jgi:hypothetical protein